jgi:membrane-bound serine protease (ClpP class)
VRRVRLEVMVLRHVLLVAAAFLLLGMVGAQEPAAQSPVLATHVQGPITPVSAAQLSDAIRAADEGNYAALLIELDTPGGLDTSMRSIVRDILGSDVPVVVYVAPSGARAGSAGAFITLAAHVAAMAPGTNIGAATPVDLQGGDLAVKIVNDATAFIQSIAEQRGRNPEVAADMVRQGRSVSASEALELRVVDLMAGSREELLSAIDGRQVSLGSGAQLELDTAGAPVTEFEMPFTRRVLQALANPELAFIFLSIGVLAIIFELATPGGAIIGAIGAILLALAFVALSVLEVNIAGVLLLALAVALFIAELFAPGLGVFAGGGTLALVFAGLLLFQRPSGLGITLPVLLAVAALVGIGVVLAARLAWRVRNAPPYQGAGGTLLGAVGTVRQATDRSATVFVQGALWSARSTDGALQSGDRVRVTGREGLELLVEPDAGEVSEPT